MRSEITLLSQRLVIAIVITLHIGHAEGSNSPKRPCYDLLAVDSFSFELLKELPSRSHIMLSDGIIELTQETTSTGLRVLTATPYRSLLQRPTGKLTFLDADPLPLLASATSQFLQEQYLRRRWSPEFTKKATSELSILSSFPHSIRQIIYDPDEFKVIGSFASIYSPTFLVTSETLSRQMNWRDLNSWFQKIADSQSDKFVLNVPPLPVETFFEKDIPREYFSLPVAFEEGTTTFTVASNLISEIASLGIDLTSSRREEVGKIIYKAYLKSYFHSPFEILPGGLKRSQHAHNPSLNSYRSIFFSYGEASGIRLYRSQVGFNVDQLIQRKASYGVDWSRLHGGAPGFQRLLSREGFSVVAEGVFSDLEDSGISLATGQSWMGQSSGSEIADLIKIHNARHFFFGKLEPALRSEIMELAPFSR